MKRDHSVILRLYPSNAFWTLVDYDGYSISSKGFFPTVVDIMVIWVKFSHSSPFISLMPKMSMFTPTISCLTISNMPWFMDLTFHGPIYIALYSIGLTFITNHIHNWVFLLWLCLFILSGVTSPGISSCILDAYWPWEFIFRCPIFLPFHTVHGVLNAKILKWFAIPFSTGPRFVRTLHHDLSILGGLTWHGS